MVVKKSLIIFSIVILLISISFVSASWFGNLFGGKSTGRASGDLGTDWTQWFDRDGPSGSGDYEDLTTLKKENIGKICDSPTDIECQTIAGLDYTTTEEVVICDVNKGATCINAQQPDGKCNYDYKVRFYCGSPSALAPNESTSTNESLTGDKSLTGESCEILGIEEAVLRPGDVGDEKGGILNNRFLDFGRNEVLTIDETFSTQLEDGKTYYIPIPSQQCYWEASYENGELYMKTVCPTADVIA